jgi:hypothetical protein
MMTDRDFHVRTCHNGIVKPPDGWRNVSAHARRALADSLVQDQYGARRAHLVTELCLA